MTIDVVLHNLVKEERVRLMGRGEVGVFGESPIIDLMEPPCLWGLVGGHTGPDVTITVSKYFLIISTIKYFRLTDNGGNVADHINDTVPSAPASQHLGIYHSSFDFTN